MAVNTRFAFDRTRADQPFSLFCEQPIAGRDVAVSLSQPVNGSLRGQRFEFGRSLQIFGNATHLALSMMVNLTSEQELEARQRVSKFLEDIGGDEHHLAVEGLKFLLGRATKPRLRVA